MRLNPFKLSINNLSATVHNEMPRHLKIRNIAQHSKKSTWAINPQSSWSFTVNNHNKLNIAQHSKERHGDNIRPWIFFFFEVGGGCKLVSTDATDTYRKTRFSPITKVRNIAQHSKERTISCPYTRKSTVTVLDNTRNKRHGRLDPSQA